MSSLQGKLSALVLCATALVFCNPARADLVTNGGFETGSFSGWTGTGNTVFNGVTCPGPGATVHGGNCAAFFGPVGSTGGISQNLATTPGTTYRIDFFFLPDGGNPSSFQRNIRWDHADKPNQSSGKPLSGIYFRCDRYTE